MPYTTTSLGKDLRELTEGALSTGHFTGDRPVMVAGDKDSLTPVTEAVVLGGTFVVIAREGGLLTVGGLKTALASADPGGLPVTVRVNGQDYALETIATSARPGLFSLDLWASGEASQTLLAY